MAKKHISYSEYATLYPNAATVTEWVEFNWIQGGKEESEDNEEDSEDE